MEARGWEPPWGGSSSRWERERRRGVQWGQEGTEQRLVRRAKSLAWDSWAGSPTSAGCLAQVSGVLRSQPLICMLHTCRSTWSWDHKHHKQDRVLMGLSRLLVNLYYVQ